MTGSTATLQDLRGSSDVHVIFPPGITTDDLVTPYAAVVSQQQHLVQRGDFVKLSLGDMVSRNYICIIVLIQSQWPDDSGSEDWGSLYPLHRKGCKCMWREQRFFPYPV